MIYQFSLKRHFYIDNNYRVTALNYMLEWKSKNTLILGNKHSIYKAYIVALHSKLQY
jgi:hypothetical protein